ncbi:MAG: hypothetical protein Q8830_02960 [Candidatus Phytoplasma australasiaticum]|nr:hypothetical protein [Candidatus Phytoplasma australasiaticum]
MKIEIKGKDNTTTRIVKVRVEYDVMRKYCKRSKLQGHSEDECKVLHPELTKKVNKGVEGMMGGEKKNSAGNNGTQWHPTGRRFTRIANKVVTTAAMRLEETPVPVNNSFNVIGNIDKSAERENEGEGDQLTTKQWITKNFYNNDIQIGEQSTKRTTPTGKGSKLVDDNVDHQDTTSTTLVGPGNLQTKENQDVSNMVQFTTQNTMEEGEIEDLNKAIVVYDQTVMQKPESLGVLEGEMQSQDMLGDAQIQDCSNSTSNKVPTGIDGSEGKMQL